MFKELKEVIEEITVGTMIMLDQIETTLLLEMKEKLSKEKQMEMLELKSMIIEMKISLEGSVVDVNWQKKEPANLKIDWERLHNPRTERKALRKNDWSLREMWDTIKHINMCAMGVPEEETRERKRKNMRWSNS